TVSVSCERKRVTAIIAVAWPHVNHRRPEPLHGDPANIWLQPLPEENYNRPRHRGVKTSSYGIKASAEVTAPQIREPPSQADNRPSLPLLVFVDNNRLNLRDC